MNKPARKPAIFTKTENLSLHVSHWNNQYFIIYQDFTVVTISSPVWYCPGSFFKLIVFNFYLVHLLVCPYYVRPQTPHYHQRSPSLPWVLQTLHRHQASLNNFIKSVTSCSLENVHIMFYSSLPILKHLTLITTILNF